VKETFIDHGDWTETQYEPDDPPIGNGKTNGGAAPAGAKVEAKAAIMAWPVLDNAAYYGLAGKVVMTLLPETEADPAALLLQYLASFGNMVGRDAFVRLANANHHPNIFVLIAGRTARSRKGTSGQDIRAVIERADSDWTRDNVKSGISSGEGIIEMVRDARQEWDKKTSMLVTVDPGVLDKRLLLDEREFSSALNKMKQETNIVSRILREAWDCYPPVLATRTKHKQSVATNPCISLVAHITIDELRQRLDKLSISDGFGNRILYSCIDRSKLLPFGGDLDPAVLDSLGAETIAAVRVAQTLGRLTIAEEAKPLWAQIYKTTEKETPLTSGLIDHLTARAATQTLRLALLYALLDGSPQIKAPHIEAARALWQFCEASARYIFSDLSSDHVADTILRELIDIRPEGMIQRDIIHDVFGRNVRALDIREALRKLEAAGKVRHEMRTHASGRGRPAKTWFAV
jgi:hypothetical protein